MTITLELRVEDAESILMKAARDAAEFGALLDHVNRKTGNVRHRGTGESYDDARKRWHQRFVTAKRMVEAFGLDYEPTSEAEALTVDYRYIGGTTKIHKVHGIGSFGVTSGSQPDYDHPYPSMRGEIFTEACRYAAKRVVSRWREALEQKKAA